MQTEERLIILVDQLTDLITNLQGRVLKLEENNARLREHNGYSNIRGKPSTHGE